ncbi:aminoglycoside phosphotransferase family protein [Halogeometricum sp. S1BR25-6]|uniref:Aminoglycoside phosphotransferase family protein n=1 Tax=Halogeometricum salsisoli TaxID=2950536 RepID=A0ABU2GD76_9EURY|nr:phosphotransferase [Halogeometricum sp. S1BR25-6]MDS0298747.1 aminoglycoside phosphotransferase family protein [Halogeometricum sp. S1BR25-6]
MTRDARERLAKRFADYRIARRLHDVPPHEVYEIALDGRRAVYKGDIEPTGNAAVEGRIIDIVGRETAVPVPEIRHVGDDYYVATWHSGAPAPDASDEADEAWARAAGRGLATLHEETEPLVDGYGPFRAAGGSLRVETADDWHGAAVDDVRQRRSVLAEYGHADVADAVVGFLRDRPDAFDGAGDPVCCHGWWTPEHVAVSDRRVACVVDFEHATAAPGEWDYLRTVTPTFAARGEDATAARRAFRRGYESVRSLPPGFERRRQYYRLVNGVYYLQSLYVQDQHGSAATAERAKRFRARMFETMSELG